MYNIFDHGLMIADRVRGDAYARAISATVRRGDVVVDLGTGTGIFAILARRAGACRVYAIESAEIIELAREVAISNGCSDGIEFIHSESRKVELPERADVMIADVRGVIPFFSTSLLAFIDARKRLLREGGVLIPQKDVISAALVESPGAYAGHDEPWSAQWEGIDLTSARRLAVNNMRKRMIERDELISEPAVVTTLEYATLSSTDFESAVELAAGRDATAHGFALWFDTTLAPGVTFSNAPGMPPTLYGRSFVPFERPVAVRQGDTICIDLGARLLNEDDYLWRWNTVLKRRNGECQPLFRQSTFFGYPRKFGVGE